ncbi:hypothetical protein MCC02030_13970 [Bifidobacteriaceae bacterium MCC02030]|nr:hypothetical protein MCC02030_13970 [Bifidobacteriaceae bacterium MCC02030]
MHNKAAVPVHSGAAAFCVAGDAAGNEADIAASCAVSPAPCLNCSYSNSEMVHVVDGEGAVAALPVG